MLLFNGFNTYPNNGDSLDGIFETGRLVFGVLGEGHFVVLIGRRIDSWNVLVPIVVIVVE